MRPQGWFVSKENPAESCFPLKSLLLRMKDQPPRASETMHGPARLSQLHLSPRFSNPPRGWVRGRSSLFLFYPVSLPLALCTINGFPLGFSSLLSEEILSGGDCVFISTVSYAGCGTRYSQKRLFINLKNQANANQNHEYR